MAKKKFYGKTLQSPSMLPSGGNAGLPENIVMKSYSKTSSLDIVLNDSMEGMDQQQMSDLNGVKKQIAKNKY